MRKGFWIWNILNCEKGNPLAIAAEASKAGLTDVFIKVADGKFSFNVNGKNDLALPTVEALKAVGVRVWGWQYVYGVEPAAEARMAVKRINELGLDGFVVDAEKEFKVPGAGAKAAAYFAELKKGYSGTLAFTAYRFPSLHREFPWDVFFLNCAINMPQVYWEQAHNSGEQLARCLREFRGMSSLPIMPIGAAYKWNGWRSELADVQRFEATAAAEHLELVSYWSWEHCRRDLPELWPIAKSEPKPPVQERLALIEQKVLGLDQMVAALRQAVNDLKSIL